MLMWTQSYHMGASPRIFPVSVSSRSKAIPAKAKALSSWCIYYFSRVRTICSGRVKIYRWQGKHTRGCEAFKNLAQVTLMNFLPAWHLLFSRKGQRPLLTLLRVFRPQVLNYSLQSRWDVPQNIHLLHGLWLCHQETMTHQFLSSSLIL